MFPSSGTRVRRYESLRKELKFSDNASNADRLPGSRIDPDASARGPIERDRFLRAIREEIPRLLRHDQ